MRITDIYFLSAMTIILIIITTSVFIGFYLPYYVTNLWWLLLLPVALLKIFFPNSKLTNWFEKERF